MAQIDPAVLAALQKLADDHDIELADVQKIADAQQNLLAAQNVVAACQQTHDQAEALAVTTKALIDADCAAVDAAVASPAGVDTDPLVAKLSGDCNTYISQINDRVQKAVALNSAIGDVANKQADLDAATAQVATDNELDAADLAALNAAIAAAYLS